LNTKKTLKKSFKYLTYVNSTFIFSKLFGNTTTSVTVKLVIGKIKKEGKASIENVCTKNRY